MSSTPLFRPEATQFSRERVYWGRVTLVQPPAVSRTVWLLTVGVVALIIFLLQAPYARKENVPGYLAPVSGTARIHAPQPGVIARVHVSEGDTVQAGQTLFSIDTAKLAADGRDINASILSSIEAHRDRLTQQMSAEIRRAELERLRLDSLIAGSQAEIDQLALQISTQQERVRIAERNLSNGEMLKAQGFVSDAENDQRRAAWLEQKQSLANLLQQKSARETQLRQQRFTLEQLPQLTSDRLNTLKSEASTLEQRSAEVTGRGAYVIVSPINGRVTSLQAKVGHTADTRMLMATVVPHQTPLQAELFVPTRSVGFVTPGKTVKILYDAFPYQNFGTYGGRITQVSRTLITPNDAVGPLNLSEPAYRVTVSLDRPDVDAYGERVALQPDMLLRADIILDRRPLMEWILDPFKSAGQRVSPS